MKRTCSRLLNKVLPAVAVIYSNTRTLQHHGQLRSARSRTPVDKSNAPLPWYTYPAIEYLRSFDFSNCHIFEYGSGNSSLFWADRSCTVTSVEENKDWHMNMNRKKRPNQEILHRPCESSYIEALRDQARNFDIIIVDGNWRIGCVHAAMQHLANDGMIILDNSDRKIELECGRLLRAQEFMQIDFSGFGPINRYAWTTSIFFKSLLTLQRQFKGPRPTGGAGN